EERRLDRMQLIAVRESLDRRDLVAVMYDREAETGINSPAVDEHRARAALPVIAAFLRTGQLQMFAKRIEQRRSRIDLERMLLAVNLERYLRRSDRSTRRCLRGFRRSESHERRSKTDRRASSGHLFQKTTPSCRTAENEEVIQSTGRID